MRKKIWRLVKRTISEWSEDKAPRLAAALAYYAGFSMAPILVIAIAIASLFYDRQAVQDLVIAQIGGLAGSQGGELIATMLEASRDIGSNSLAIGVSIAALIFGATGVFGQLQDALNTIWEVAPKPGQGILSLVKKRFFSFTMVISVGFLLLISLVLSAALSALASWSMSLFSGLELVLQVVNFIVSLFVITVLFALIFKYVPDADVKQKDVWLGATVTAVLFTLGKAVIGFYLGNSSTVDQFGGAGALVVILLWVYYSAQITFLGAEFTQVYANAYGSRVVPDEDAVSLSKEARAEQGIPADGGFVLASRPEKPVSSKPLQSISGARKDLQTPLAKAEEGRRAETSGVSMQVFSIVIAALVSMVSGFLLGNLSKSK